MAADLEPGAGSLGHVPHRDAPQRHLPRGPSARRCSGVSLGAPDGLLPPGPDNPAGYWENKSIQEFDDELLAALGGAWDQPPVLAPGWELDPQLDPERARAEAILATDFTLAADDGARWIGFKDPRVSLLLPFWRTVLPIATTIVVVRDPRRGGRVPGDPQRDRPDPGRGALDAVPVRLHHRRPRAPPAHPPPAVRRPRPTVARITAHLDLPGPTAAVRAQIVDHVDPDLRHHRAAGRRPDENPVMELALTVWNDGVPDLSALTPALVDALAHGWLRPASDGEAVATARAEAVSFKEQLKRRNEKVRNLEAALRARDGDTG